MFLEWFQSHSLVILLVLATCVCVVWLLLAYDRIRLGIWQTLMLAVVHTLLGVLSVKVFAIIEGFGDLSVVGNMSLFGGMAFLPIFYAALAHFGHRDARDVFDVLTISLVGTLFFARINCIVSGCCQGAFIPGTTLRWPTRELELAYYVVFIVMLAPRVLKGDTRGEVFPLYMVSYGAFRFVIEFFRASSRAFGPFHIAHLWAAIAIVLGASILVELKQQEQEIERERKVRR